MYDIIENIINHVYQTSYSGDQQYIYYISGALIILMLVFVSDLTFRVFRHFWR